VNAAALVASWVWSQWVPEAAWRRVLLPLLGVVAVPFLLNIWVQGTWTEPKGGLVFGDTLDPDVGLYFCYGRQFVGWPPTPTPPCDNPSFGDGRYPAMEYPQGALGLFAAGVLLSGDSAATFRFVFPLIVLVCTLGCVALLHALGRAYGATRATTLLTFPLTLSPTLFRLAPVRYDLVPEFCLILGVWLFIRSRRLERVKDGGSGTGEEAAIELAPEPDLVYRIPHFAIGVALAAGTLLKWLPGLVLPFVAGYFLRQGAWRVASSVLAASGVVLLIVLVPFYFWDAARFWHPYLYQTSRGLIGESAWFPLQYALLDPDHTLPSRPWGEPPSILVRGGVITGVQIVLTLVPLALAWGWARTREQWAALGLSSVAIFTLTNSIFSPQFVLALGFTWAAALIVGRPDQRAILLTGLALLAIGLGNFLVFPLAVSGWIAASTGMFVLACALTVGIIVLTLRSRHADG